MKHAGKDARAPRNTRNTRKTPRNRPRPNYLLLLLIFLTSALVTGVGAFATHTPALAIREVKIHGVKLADRACVEKVAGTALKQNILLLRKSPIIHRIAQVSEVSEVRMGRSFPNGVWIRIAERKPAAVLTDGRRYCMVQSDGLVFHNTAGPVKGIALITLAERCLVREGRIAGSPHVKSALETLASIRRNSLRVTKISVDRAGDICLNMGGDFYVRIGQSDEISKKISLLRRALVYKPSLTSKAEYIDLSCPSAPVWKPKEVAQAGV